MKKENISNALNNIDFDMVEDAYESTKQKKKSQKILWHKGGVIAACLALMIIVTITALPQMLAPSGSVEGPQIDNINPSGNPQIDNVSPSEGSQNDDVSASEREEALTLPADPSLSAPKEFTSIEEFVSYEKNLVEASSKCYYIPSALGDDYDFYGILRQEKNSITTYEHITVKYKIKGADINEESYNDISTKIISCEYSVREYSDTAFENYANNGFEAFEYGGKLLYMKGNYTADQTTLLSYKVIFLIDDHLIVMNLPAIDSFENMMQYTDVIRVDIE